MSSSSQSNCLPNLSKVRKAACFSILTKYFMLLVLKTVSIESLIAKLCTSIHVGSMYTLIRKIYVITKTTNYLVIVILLPRIFPLLDHFANYLGNHFIRIYKLSYFNFGKYFSCTAQLLYSSRKSGNSNNNTKGSLSRLFSQCC